MAIDQGNRAKSRQWPDHCEGIFPAL